MTLLTDIEVVPEAAPDEDRRRRTRSGRVDSERPNRSRAAQRAIDRRRKRLDTHPTGDRRSTGHRGRATAGAPRPTLSEWLRRVPFVVPVLALLVLGLALSLWLSTKAAQDSYALSVERKQNQALMDRRDTLKRTYESGDSAPELSDKAARLGMIPARNPARMVIGPNGRPRIQGNPTPAEGAPMGSINPDPKPDPTSTIDKTKVDDSMGLPGGNTAAPGQTAPGQTSPGQAEPGQGNSGAAQPGSPQPAPSPAPAPAPAGGTPAPTIAPNPNVAPPSATPPPPASDGAPAPANGNPPRANSPERR
ncbi:hypothetical protein GCM10009624_33290 [Gordonia sinesedis]